MNTTLLNENVSIATQSIENFLEISISRDYGDALSILSTNTLVSDI